MSRKTGITLIVSLIIAITLGIISIITISSMTSIKSQISSNSNQIDLTEPSLEEEIPEVETKVISDKFINTPGYSYFTDKGAMKLYLDVVPTNTDTLYLYGVEYHNEMDEDVLMPDATIKEIFYKTGDDTYINKDSSITVHYKYEDNSVSIEDKRDHVSLLFTGRLSKMPENIEEEKPQPNIIVAEEENEEIEEEKEENTPREELKIDGYSDESEVDNSIRVITSGSELNTWMNPDNEQQDIQVTGIFQQAYIEWNGTRYKTLDGSIEFYTFGELFRFDPTETNVATITMTYRGSNPKFNGMDFGGTSEQCFVVKSMRRPTKSEVNGE